MKYEFLRLEGLQSKTKMFWISFSGNHLIQQVRSSIERQKTGQKKQNSDEKKLESSKQSKHQLELTMVTNLETKTSTFFLELKKIKQYSRFFSSAVFDEKLIGRSDRCLKICFRRKK